MKRVSIVALSLCASFTLLFGLIGCAGDNDSQQETATDQPDAAERSTQPVGLDEFVEVQNGMFSTMNSEDLAIVVSSEDTVLVYTYQYFKEGLYEEIGQNAWNQVADEGSILFEAAKDAVPEITSVRIVFEDGEGNELRSAEFSE